jgi:hypothetical protein
MILFVRYLSTHLQFAIMGSVLIDFSPKSYWHQMGMEGTIGFA